MVHDASDIGIGESDAAKGHAAEYLARRVISILAKEKAGLRAEVGVAPAVQNQAGDITPRVEAYAGEHRGELLADAALVLAERSAPVRRGPG